MNLSTEMRQIVDFVEGRLDVKAFERALYENPNFESVLNGGSFSSNASVEGDLYLYAIRQNFNSPGDVLNLHGTLTRFLERDGLMVQPTTRYHEFYRLILSAQPKWLDVDPVYIQREIMPASGERSGKELEAWLRAEFLKRFVCVGKTPRWIQSPQWPIGEKGPLVFFGQVRVEGYFHDEAAVYVFYEPASGNYEVIRQTY